MQRLLFILVAFFIPFSIALAAAPAPTPKTGQARSYAARDDGALQPGVAWPTPRFTDNTEGTVTDNLTGLIWLKNANCFGAQNWDSALIKSNTLASGACGLNDGSIAGDWHLPNDNELWSLVDYWRSSPALPLNHPFTSVPSNYYLWSSTTYAGSTSLAWYMNMGTGFVNYGKKTDNRYVWPVRSGQSGNWDTFILSISKQGSGSGTVTSSTGGINCGSTCSTSITSGTSVTLTADPSSGSTFTGWTGSCSGSGTCQVSMDAAKSVTATFTLAPTVSKPGDCNGDKAVTIAEVQSAINMFLGLKSAEVCVDQDSFGGVSIAEVQKVINSFLGL